MGLLSPLASLQPHEMPEGLAVLSICSGIGGVEVALQRLGILVRSLVYVEIDDDCSAVSAILRMEGEERRAKKVFVCTCHGPHKYSSKKSD